MHVDTPAGATWSRDLDILSLLGRSPLPLDAGAPAEALRGSAVLVTGAGGSIGVALSQRLCEFSLARLILLDHHEPSLFAVQQQLGGCRLPVAYVLADVRDRAKMFDVCEKHRPDYVFHLAAYKHVPLGEANPDQVVATNVLGTSILAEAAVSSGCRRFVYPSTDKAVEPVNVYGASKRAAELCLMAGQREGARTSFAVSRLVNTIGAQGGVIRLFAQQIAAREPLTLTHPDMTRYWISMDEAVGFLLLAAVAEPVLGAFILDLGEPVGLLAIAERLATLIDGPASRPEVRYLGMRPGERLYELLAYPHETVVPTAFTGLNAALWPCKPDPDALMSGIDRLERLLPAGETAAITRQLYAFVRAQGGVPGS